MTPPKSPLRPPREGRWRSIRKGVHTSGHNVSSHEEWAGPRWVSALVPHPPVGVTSERKKYIFFRPDLVSAGRVRVVRSRDSPERSPVPCLSPRIARGPWRCTVTIFVSGVLWSWRVVRFIGYIRRLRMLVTRLMFLYRSENAPSCACGAFLFFF